MPISRSVLGWLLVATVLTTPLVGAVKRMTLQEAAQLTSVTVQSTGLANGKVATLQVSNNEDYALEIKVQPSLTPGNAKETGYLLLDTVSLRVGPHSKLNMPLRGYSLDMEKALVSAKMNLPAPTTWKTPVDDGFLQEVMDIERAYSQLSHEDRLVTPYMDDADKQRSAITQQAVWMAYGKSMGKTYDKDQLRNRLAKQLSEKTGHSVDELDQNDRELFEMGIEAIWDSVSQVNNEAQQLNRTRNNRA